MFTSKHSSMEHQQCAMNMVFTWDYKNLCIVFPFWQITTQTSFAWSVVAVILLGFCYEAVRSMAGRLDQPPLSQRGGLPSNSGADERSQPLRHRRGRRWLISAVYAFQVFYSFFLMLVFMTYNGYFMLAVVFGAFLGHLHFQKNKSYSDASRGMACH